MKANQAYDPILKDLASTMLDVARESVSLVKRSDQSQALKLTRTQEWEMYLEFLKVLFNLADRMSAFYIPIQTQPEFMDALEDAVSERLHTVLAPTLSSAEIDAMQIVVSVGQTVAESRTVYEGYKFVVTEESKDKEAYFELLGKHIAGKAGASNNETMASSASLCARAIIPAMKALFEGSSPPTEPTSSEQPVANPSDQSAPPVSSHAPSDSSHGPSAQTIKLISVLARISGEEIETRWGVPPRFQRDLKPEEANDLAHHMNRVTRILGERFATITASMNCDHAPQSGNA